MRRRENNGSFARTQGLAAFGVAWALIIGFLPLAVTGCTEQTSAGPDLGATISEIAENPTRYYGQVATVSGEVNDVIGPNAFTIGGDEFIGGEELLVIVPKPPAPIAGRPATAPWVRDDIIQVTGPVRQLVIAEIEKEFGLDLNDELIVEFERKPVLIARAVDLTPRAGVVGAAAGVLTLDDIEDNPERFFGQTVTVSGEVGQIFGRNAFYLVHDELLGDDEMLTVVPTPAAAPWVKGNVIQVTGTVRPFVLAEIERDTGIDLDLDREIVIELERKPVIVARSVNVTPPATR